MGTSGLSAPQVRVFGRLSIANRSVFPSPPNFEHCGKKR